MQKKLLWIIIPIIVFAASLGITSAVIISNRAPAATPDEAAMTDSAVPTVAALTAAPTVEPTEAPTEEPTEPDYTDAYRAYLEVLKDNESDIRAYDWQYKDDPSHPVAFADIMGDDIPEMIYAYVDQNDTKPQMGGANAAAVHIKVITFDGSKAVEATDYGFPIYGGSDSGMMFVAQIDGELYTFDHETGGVYQFDTAHRFIDTEDNTLRRETAVRDTQTPAPGTGTAEYIIDDQTVSPSEAAAAYAELVKNTDVILMSSSDSQGNSYPRTLGLDAERYPNQSKTYVEAVAYLKDLLGEETVSSGSSAEAPDFSVIAGEYHYLKEHGSDESDFTFRTDGSFTHHSYNFTGAWKYDSTCNAKVVSVEQDQRIPTKYTFTIADQELEHPAGDTGTIEWPGYTVTYEFNDYALIQSNKTLAVYLPGTDISDLTADEYNFFKRFEDTEAPSGKINTALLSISSDSGVSMYKQIN